MGRRNFYLFRALMNNLVWPLLSRPLFFGLEFHTLPPLVLPSQTLWADAKPNDLR